MEYKTAVLAVKSVEASRRFYCGLLEQTVALDLGKALVFNGGFTVQEEFAQLTRVHPSSVQRASHNMELYFETERYDAFLQKIASSDEVSYVHPPRLHDWQQRTVRIYDPDGHMVEIAEAMRTVAQRFLNLGYSTEETASIIRRPVKFVESCR